MSKRLDGAQGLATGARNPYQEAQLVIIAYDLNVCTAVLNNACKEWRHLPDANKTWANFKLFYADAHTKLQEMQSAAQELHYSTGIINNAETETYGIQDQTADALHALASTTADDRHAVANLSHTNVLLNDQVANLSKKSQHKTQKLTN
eukprot:6436262-Ditylum_brightwellii.AAC.1